MRFKKLKKTPVLQGGGKNEKEKREERDSSKPATKGRGQVKWKAGSSRKSEGTKRQPPSNTREGKKRRSDLGIFGDEEKIGRRCVCAEELDNVLVLQRRKKLGLMVKAAAAAAANKAEARRRREGKNETHEPACESTVRLLPPECLLDGDQVLVALPPGKKHSSKAAGAERFLCNCMVIRIAAPPTGTTGTNWGGVDNVGWINKREAGCFRRASHPPSSRSCCWYAASKKKNNKRWVSDSAFLVTHHTRCFFAVLRGCCGPCRRALPPQGARSKTSNPVWCGRKDIDSQ
jgi:hypothetical protein